MTLELCKMTLQLLYIRKKASKENLGSLDFDMLPIW